MDVSVLDVLPVGSGGSAREALLGARTLAEMAERLGFARLWFAEHHGMPSIASTSPELLIAHVGAYTQRIRLGAGGVMLPNHTPLRVVEQLAPVRTPQEVQATGFSPERDGRIRPLRRPGPG